MISHILAEQILILFMIMAVGFIARRANIIRVEMTKGLSDLLLNITLPFLIITSFNSRFSQTLLVNGGVVLASTFAVHFVSYVLGKLLFFRYPSGNRKILLFATVFSNCGFMGIPIVESVFGKLGVFYSSIYLIGFNLLVWTLGIIIFTEKADRQTARATLTNPGIIAVLIGTVLFIFSIPLPAPIIKTFSLVGSMTTPLSMIIIGATLADCRWKEFFSGTAVYYGSLTRLVLLPLITMGTMILLQLDPTVIGVCVLSVAMPVAATTVMFAERYDSDTLFASRLVFLSTILSAVTIPGLMILFEIFVV